MIRGVVPLRAVRALVLSLAVVGAASFVSLPVAHGDAEDTGTIISGHIPSNGGFGLITFGGGTFAQLVEASGCLGGAVAFWSTDANGDFVPFLPQTTVEAVNEPFVALFPGDMIPRYTPLVGRCLPAPAIRTVTFEDDGGTLELSVGDTFDLRLGDGYDWAVQVADESVVSRVLFAFEDGMSQGMYQALRAGSTTLSATGTPTCYPACLMPSVLFTLTIVVR